MPQLLVANDKNQKQLVLVEQCHHHQPPSKDGVSVLVLLHSYQMLHTETAKQLLHQLLTFLQAASQTARQETVFVPTFTTSINKLKN